MLKVSLRRTPVASLIVRKAAITPSLCVFGIESDRARLIGDRVVELSEAPIGATSMAVGPDLARVLCNVLRDQLDGLCERLQGLGMLDAILVLQREASIGPHGSELGVQRDARVGVSDRTIELLGLVVKVRAIVEAVDVSARELELSVVAPLGLLELQQ